MAIGRSEDRDTPGNPLVLRHHGSVWDPIRVTHLGQRSNRPRSKGRTYDRNRPDRHHCTALASRGPSTYRFPLFAGMTKEVAVSLSNAIQSDLVIEDDEAMFEQPFPLDFLQSACVSAGG